jgi:hypothetical protein
MEENTLWIVLAVVLGSLTLALAAVFFLFCRRRAKKKVRGFSLRAVTPLDDAEFESWRRPSQYTQRPEKYGIRQIQPAPVSVTKATPMFEKDVHYEAPRTPSPQDNDYVSMTSPTNSVRKPERVRRKSSVCSSVADRPPTPYSPASTTSEFPRSSYASRSSYAKSPRIHYPSMSEASAFNFNFHSDSDPQAHDPARRSDDRPLNLSYQHGWHSEKV